MNPYCTAMAGALVLLMAAPHAYAQERTGFAVQGGIGGSLMKDRDGSQTFEGDGFGYYFGLEYRFVPRFAFGLDVFNLGTASDTIDSVDTEVEAKGIDLFGRLIFPVSDAVEVYGRIGTALYDAHVNTGRSTIPFGEDGKSIGAGLDIGLYQLSFRLEGRYIVGSREESGALLTAGFSYRF